jgi:hypothetical protein
MFLQRYVKRPLHPLLLTPLPNKKDQITTLPHVNNRELLIFQAPCPFLGATFHFSLINPTLCADLVVSRVNLLYHEPILWPMEASALDTSLQQ